MAEEVDEQRFIWRWQIMSTSSNNHRRHYLATISTKLSIAATSSWTELPMRLWYAVTEKKSSKCTNSWTLARLFRGEGCENVDYNAGKAEIGVFMHPLCSLLRKLR